MDKDRIEGTVKEGWGKAEEKVGDATNNPGTEVEGKKDQAEGNLQQGWGKAKDAGRDALDNSDTD
jgi:CsbD-like.